MNIYVTQTINIHSIKIGSVSNSSVFQIGTSGIIKPASYLYNTGGFIKPAPRPKTLNGPVPISPIAQPLVPFNP
ncbi:spore germination protein GerPB [Aeribacillus pallidus]|jgi:spore germination protein PB|uniref:spore germination protein GerPB n=1 Tax=Aeribacillus pallidus TaxID=33936 RepID=UPI001D987FCF|nr:spore gernimation protein [Bacillus sp. (in: firmicutes)]